MNLPEERQPRTAWIPWIFALVTLLGVNALVPDHSRLRRSETPDEIGISQLADPVNPPGRTLDPPVFLTAHASPRCGQFSLPSSLLCIGMLHETPAGHSPAGQPQGRAPPAGSLS
ncbi:MAG: hypothetical protein ACRDBP_02410 [Luteolibacter sp.]